MAFDLNTAKPVKFDISTANPLEQQFNQRTQAVQKEMQQARAPIGMGLEGVKNVMRSAAPHYGIASDIMAGPLESEPSKVRRAMTGDFVESQVQGISDRPIVKTPFGGLSKRSIAQFGGEVALDPFTYLSGGPEAAGAVSRIAKTVASPITKPIGATTRFLGRTARGFAGVPEEAVQSARALSAKRGPAFVFDKAKEAPEYVGEKIAPKASEKYSQRILSMEPEALKQAGIADDVIKDIQSYKQSGAKSLPKPDEAETFFSQTISNAPSDIKSDAVVVALNDAVRQAPREFKPLLDDISKSTNLDAAITGKGNVISKDKFMDIYRRVNQLFGGNEYTDRLAQGVKEALYKSARESGVKDIDKAVQMFRISKGSSKAYKLLGKDKATAAAEMQSKLKSASKPESVQQKNILREKLGPEAQDILDELEAQRVSKEMSVGTENPNITGLRLRGLRNMIRGYEKARASLPKMVVPKGLKKGALSQIIEDLRSGK